MSRREPDAGDRADRAPVDPQDVLRIVRQIGFGLLVASLFVDWGARRLAWGRAQLAAAPYRILPSALGPGALLADAALEMLDATSSRSPTRE
jgi:hypothetical protein